MTAAVCRPCLNQNRIGRRGIKGENSRNFGKQTLHAPLKSQENQAVAKKTILAILHGNIWGDAP
jgi:hypothetical protein